MLLLGLFGLFLISDVLPKSISNDQFAIIFDAGSKGTRLYVYKYQLVPVNYFGEIRKELGSDIQEILYCELKDGGLSSYQDVSEIRPKFKGCMDLAGQVIPKEKQPQTFITLIATAGMRLLEYKNKTHADNLLTHLRFYFAESGYLYNDPEQVRIINGQEEGIFAFIASNYYQNKFSSKNFNPNTNGILDLGGASTQLAFVPTSVNFNANLNLNHYIFDVKLNNQVYKIYSYSFLCFGTAQILTMYNTKMLKDFGYTNSLKVSCYPEGSDQVLTGEEILDTVCVNGQIYDQSYEFTIDKTKIKPSQSYKFQGNSKKNKCREEVNKLIPQQFCPYGSNQCSFNGVYLPPISESQFLALGNFYEAIDLTSRLFKTNFQNDLNGFNDTTTLICSMTYTQLKNLNEQNQAEISKKRLAKLCLENVYILKLLELYGFKNLVNVNAVEQINNNKINWILGYLINELNNENSNILYKNPKISILDPVDNIILF